jgi:uncharacterized metal-binding protein YceD (DUF177 family)
MGNPLRDRRTAAELASDGQVIEIADKISSFDGLASIVEADLAALDSDKMPSGWRDCAVLGDLRFGFADEKRRIPMVSGRATADVAAVCQRCLEPFQLQLEIEPKLLLLEMQQAADGYDDYEVWELDEQTLQPQDIVEELLIMAMPFSAMHDNVADCKVLLSADLSDDPSDDSSDDDGTDKLVKPFAALRSQMK